MLIPFLFIVALGLSWGVHFPLLRFMGEQGFDFGTIIAFVVAGVAVVLTVISVLRKRLPSTTPQALGYYFFCGLFGYLVPFSLELFSAPKVGAGVLAIIVALTPIFTVILTMLLRVEPISGKKILAVILGLIAVMPLFSFSDLDIEGVYGLGILSAVLVPLCYSFYYILVLKFWPKGMDSWQVATGESVACGIMILPIVVFGGGQDFAVFAHAPSLAGMLWMIMLSVVEVYLYFEVIRRAGVVFVSQTNFIAVVMSVLIGIFAFGEEHGLWIIACLILLGASLILSAQQTKARTGTIR